MLLRAEWTKEVPNSSEMFEWKPDWRRLKKDAPTQLARRCLFITLVHVKSHILGETVAQTCIPVSKILS